MPSTYTLNNGIELIATGEQSGTWGDTTNLNLGLVDTALDGQVTVTLPAAGTSGAPNALPISDGAASNGRNRLIIFADGGDLGATAFVQLTPNDAEKIVYIRNNLSGGRAIALFQGTYNAANDYEVPAGTTAVVFFNGGGAGAVAANVFNNAFFDSLRLGGVSVTAILDEDNMASDSATALATQQSIKAYVDAQVGANNELSEVLANGNTSGGNNIQMTTTDEVQFRDTALTIKSSVDGQLDIAADVELEIVAPTLDINASTAVTIDTTTLTMTGSVNVVGDLDVDNLNLNGNTIISTNTDGNIALTPNGTGEVDISKVDIDGGTIDGTVIGGSTAAAISGTTGQFGTSLNVDGTVTADGLTVDGTATVTGTNITIKNDASFLKFENASATRTGYIQSRADAFDIWNDQATPMVFGTNNTERMRIDSSGNVGIGVSNPSSYQGNADNLVVGNLVDAGTGLTIVSGTASLGSIHFADSPTGDDSYRGFIQYDHASNYMRFATDATERMRIDSSGNLLVGRTSSGVAGYKLQVDGSGGIVSTANAAIEFGIRTPDATFNDSYLIFGTPTHNRALIHCTGAAVNTGNLVFTTVNAGSAAEAMRITSTGLVGIGTSSPAEKMVLVGGYANFAGLRIAGTDHDSSNNIYLASGTLSLSTGSAAGIVFKTNLTERMVLDASGNVGIGTSSPAATLDVRLASDRGLYVEGSTSNPVYLRSYHGSSSSNLREIGLKGSDIRFETGSDAGTSTTEAARITSTGNVGIGTSSPASYSANANNLVVYEAGNAGITIATGTTDEGALYFADGTSGPDAARGVVYYNHTNNFMGFATDSSERMRIDASGNLLVGKTSSSSTVVGTALCSFGRTDMITSGGVCSVMNRQTSTGTILEFQYANGVIGTISTNGSTTAYNTSSDYRLKENVAPMQNALDTVAQLNPVTYTWKADGSAGQGFIAHELQAVVPDCVTGEKDAVDADGKPKYQGVDTSFLVGILTKAIQEQQTTIAALEARITALEA